MREIEVILRFDREGEARKLSPFAKKIERNFAVFAVKELESKAFEGLFNLCKAVGVEVRDVRIDCGYSSGVVWDGGEWEIGTLVDYLGFIIEKYLRTEEELKETRERYERLSERIDKVAEVLGFDP